MTSDIDVLINLINVSAEENRVTEFSLLHVMKVCASKKRASRQIHYQMVIVTSKEESIDINLKFNHLETNRAGQKLITGDSFHPDLLVYKDVRRSQISVTESGMIIEKMNFRSYQLCQYQIHPRIYLQQN